MHSDTKFSSSICYTSFDLEETRDFIDKHKTEELFGFTEEMEIKYDDSSKEFSLRIASQELKFTRDSFIEFCSCIGVSRAFALKIPNELLFECILKMIDNSVLKLRLQVRDKDIIASCKKDSFIRIETPQMLDAAGSLFKESSFREANISDTRVDFLLEPKGSPIDLQGDKFEVGFSFLADYTKGLLIAAPYSLRHCCTNIAVSKSFIQRKNPIEKITRKTAGRIYDRFFDNCHQMSIEDHKKEIEERIAASSKPLTGEEYVEVSNNLKFLGKEVTLSLLGVDKFRHREILDEVRFKRLREDSTVLNLEDLSRWEIFGSITAAAKGYLGDERGTLQRIGGLLI